MDKQLPMINENPIVQEYMKMLLNNDKKKEYRDTEELLHSMLLMMVKKNSIGLKLNLLNL